LRYVPTKPPPSTYVIAPSSFSGVTKVLGFSFFETENPNISNMLAIIIFPFYIKDEGGDNSPLSKII
jgi:hypothetical protein